MKCRLPWVSVQVIQKLIYKKLIWQLSLENQFIILVIIVNVVASLE